VRLESLYCISVVVGDCTAKFSLPRVQISETQFTETQFTDNLDAMDWAMFEYEVCSGGKSVWFDCDYPRA